MDEVKTSSIALNRVLLNKANSLQYPLYKIFQYHRRKRDYFSSQEFDGGIFCDAFLKKMTVHIKVNKTLIKS